MVAAAVIAGLAGAVLSGGGALVAGQTFLTAFGCYAGGGSATMLLVLAAGSRRQGWNPAA